MLTFKNLDEMALQFCDCVAQINPQDTIIHAAPLSHGSGLYTLPHLRNGACQVIPESGGFEVEELTNLFENGQDYHVCSANHGKQVSPI